MITIISKEIPKDKVKHLVNLFKGDVKITIEGELNIADVLNDTDIRQLIQVLEQTN